MLVSQTFPLLLFTACTIFPVRAALTNLTIDDTDLSYFTWTEDTNVVQPNIPWAAITPNSPCVYCSAKPPTANIHNQTWHDGSNNSAGSFVFQGHEVYIYGIAQVNSVNMSFTMDGNVSAFYYYSGTAQFVFNSLFFSARDLTASVNHTVSWVLHATNTSGDAGAGLFDYAVITVDQTQSGSSSPRTGSPSSTSSPPASPSKSKTKTGPIVGGVVGALTLIAAVILVVILLSRRNRTVAANTPAVVPTPRVRPTDVEPFMEQAATSPASGSMGEKTLDASWVNPLPSASAAAPLFTGTRSMANPSGVPASVPTDVASTRGLSSAAANSNSAPRTDPELHSTSTGSARERELEERVAQLETQVQQHLTQPPPYVPPPVRE
ncbi:hypothetical protein B0H16DRAFT_1647285 [Mycena metata]|uniref:Mid2 domain-containing protein n=1 Tax=Mycena metata TaxID=1033252 RepID=A0AAD7DS93_9AGAR|nr:hypothetical protein B0H16DRAFT_1647285 [Mycena metata]